MAKQKGKKGSNSSVPNNGARAKIKAEIESRQAAKKAAKKAALRARGIDPDRKKHHGKRRKVSTNTSSDPIKTNDLVYVIDSNGNVVVAGAPSVTLVTDENGRRSWRC